MSTILTSAPHLLLDKKHNFPLRALNDIFFVDMTLQRTTAPVADHEIEMACSEEDVAILYSCLGHMNPGSMEDWAAI